MVRYNHESMQKEVKTLSLFQVILFFIALGFAVYSLIQMAKQKKHYQIFPDSIKKDLYRGSRMITIINIVSVVFILIAIAIHHSSFYYVPIFVSLLMSMSAIKAQIDQKKEYGEE